MPDATRHFHQDARPAGAPAARPIAGGEGWCMNEFTCRLGPQDRPFEEVHEDMTIAAVLEGSFQYRSAAGEALLHPGSFLLGNAGTCFECGHDHGTGDRCVAFHFAPWYFEEIAAAVTGSHRFRFPAAMLPALPELALPAVEIETRAKREGPAAMDEMAVALAEIVLKTLSGRGETTKAPSAADQRRINRALRYIEEHAGRALDLAHLASVACMSKYHFLRTFRRILGVTPYQFVLGLRMRRAAVALCTTPMPVATIAFDAGFGDLSTFNGRFRATFGASPSAFRRRR
jgi:AraC family transcriptional regulator